MTLLSLSTVVLNNRDQQGMYGMQHFWGSYKTQNGTERNQSGRALCREEVVVIGAK